jgi:hypothetical protein
VFVDALGGATAEINDGNVRDLSQLCDEFKFIELAKIVGDWQLECSLIDAVIGRELDLVRTAMKAEVSGLRLLVGQTAALG